MQISKEDYEGCPDFGEIYTIAATKAKTLGASMEGGRTEKRAPDEVRVMPARIGKGMARRVADEEPHKDPSLPSARTEPRAIRLQRKPLAQAKGSKYS